MPNPVQWLVKRAAGLRFPYLFMITATLFGLDLLIPDAIPFADELLLGLITVLFGSLKKRRRTASLPEQGEPGER